MKIILTLLLLTVIGTAHGQTKQDTLNYLEQQAKIYLTNMYVRKQFDSAAKMWDNRMLFEMEDFYQKRGQGQFTDTVLFNRIKLDISKYYKQLSKFEIGRLLGSNLETDPVYIIGQTFFDCTETVKGRKNKSKIMLIFISEDKGKTWVVQDWKVKDIADKAAKEVYH